MDAREQGGSNYMGTIKLCITAPGKGVWLPVHLFHRSPDTLRRIRNGLTPQYITQFLMDRVEVGHVVLSDKAGKPEAGVMKLSGDTWKWTPTSPMDEWVYHLLATTTH